MTTASGETGVTINCSSVPRSRSFTMANAERIVPEKVSRMATRPGISRFALRESGLNIITGCASTTGWRARWAMRSFSVFCNTTPLAAASACVDTVESEPRGRTAACQNREASALPLCEGWPRSRSSCDLALPQLHFLATGFSELNEYILERRLDFADGDVCAAE